MVRKKVNPSIFKKSWYFFVLFVMKFTFISIYFWLLVENCYDLKTNQQPQYHNKINQQSNYSKVQSLSDENIMLAVCEGQIEKLGLLFERYHIKLFNFFLRTTTDRDLSHDLTQNVFERILKYKKSYKEGASFKTWFYSIARNVKIDYFKKKKVETTPFDSFDTERNLGIRNTEFDLDKNEKVSILYQSLNELPNEKREILILSQLEELEYNEIAQIFDITENAARVKVHRALKELKEIFHKKY